MGKRKSKLLIYVLLVVLALSVFSTTQAFASSKYSNDTYFFTVVWSDWNGAAVFGIGGYSNYNVTYTVGSSTSTFTEQYINASITDDDFLPFSDSLILPNTQLYTDGTRMNQFYFTRYYPGAAFVKIVVAKLPNLYMVKRSVSSHHFQLYFALG